MDDDQLVPMGDTGEASGFDVVLRGYDRRQVDDYLDRVEAALNDADARHAEDAHRLTALEQQVAELRERLADAERRAEGRPESAAATGDRIAAMLRLAEEESAAIRGAAEQEAAAARAAAEQEATATRQQAQEELRRMHEAGQLEAASMTAEARRQVADLSRQRDAIAAQLQNLRDTLAGAVGPLSAPVDPDATQAIRLPSDAARVEPGA